MPTLWKRTRSIDYLAQYSPYFDYDAAVLRGLGDGQRAGCAWDVSGNNKHCLRVAAADVPRVKLAAQNGLPAYQFTAAGQRLFTPVNARVPQEVTFFIVCKYHATAGYLFSWFSAPNFVGFAIGSSYAQLDYRAPNGQELSSGAFTAATSTGAYAIYCCTMNSTTKTGTIYKNGASIGTSTNAAMNWAGFTSTSSFRMNANLNDNLSAISFIGKLVIFPTLLTAQNIADIFAHLNSIWACY